MYEGDSYEVLDARVILKDEVVGLNTEMLTRARTFRFSGFSDELSGLRQRDAEFGNSMDRTDCSA